MRKLALTLAACGILFGSTSRARGRVVCAEGRGEAPRLHSADDRRSHTCLVVELPRQEGAA